jgi:ParB family chromosome partitioning protein
MTNLKTKAKSPTATGVKILPVADMHVSKLNMRYGKTPPDIDDIYPSILQNGINQSLLVRKEGKGWGVIAGRRRLFALKKKAKETGKPQTAPLKMWRVFRQRNWSSLRPIRDWPIAAKT